ncbi:MAG: hypothetical protein K2V38_25115, partial [Gemmataceae bacterium]|nr:hypothetical protein [Gemmataceae bacterium]
MSSRVVRPARFAGALVVVVGAVVASGPVARGATPKEIDAAIQKGAAALKQKYAKGGAAPADGTALGGTCLAGLALLEAGTPANDPAVKTVTEIVRESSYKQTTTYQIALCLMYLDRLGDP